MLASTRSIALLLLCPAIALAAPANDDWANRTAIAALPFHVVENQLDSATHDATDPAPPCGGADKTVWYGYTTGVNPAYLSVTTATGSDKLLATVAVYSGTPGAFRLVNGACSRDSGNADRARLIGVRLEPNTAYSIEVGNAVGFPSFQVVDLTVSASPVYAVTKTTDTADGVCNADCSLREAIGAANAVPGAVVVPAGTYTLTIANASVYEDANATGDLDISAGMGIYGAGTDTTVIDANHVDRALDLHGSSSAPQAVMIGNLTVTNGSKPLNVDDAFHINRGGGLRASPTQDGAQSPMFLGVERVKFSGNSAYWGGGGASIEVDGMLRDCRFTGNTGETDGGGLIARTNLDVLDSTFDDNTAGIQNGHGGAIDAASDGNVRIVNSTISGNHAAFGGGGVYADRRGIVLRSNTIVLNDVSGAGLDVGAGVDLDDTFNGSSQLSNNIIAGNTSLSDTAHADCALHGGATMSSDHNHVQHNGSCTLNGAGDVTTGDPLVIPALANNGGPTPTHALDPASPAVDGGDLAGCKDQNDQVLLCDQRGYGFPRQQGDACDKGAFEVRGDKIFRDGFDATVAVAITCPGSP